MPNSSRNSRERHSSKVSFGSRLPPGNSQSPPRCTSACLRVMRSLPLRKIRAAATSVMGAWRASERQNRWIVERGSAANAFIDEAEALHFGGIKEVAAIEENRMTERLAD